MKYRYWTSAAPVQHRSRMRPDGRFLECTAQSSTGARAVHLRSRTGHETCPCNTAALNIERVSLATHRPLAGDTPAVSIEFPLKAPALIETLAGDGPALPTGETLDLVPTAAAQIDAGFTVGTLRYV